MRIIKLAKLLLPALISGFIITSAGFAEQKPDVMEDVIPVTSEALNATPPKSGGRLWNLQDADILSVINEVSQETGKNFVVDPRVNGKISLISSKPLKKNEVYQVFLSVLGILGYSAVPSGNVIKIVPNMESAEQATMIASKQSPGKGDEVVVRVIPLQNVSASQLIPVLRPMLPQWSNISAYTPGNVLILLGRASNLERIYHIVQDVDQAAHSSIQIVTLHHASAAQVANVLTNLQTASRNAGESPAVSIAVDERSNSILLGGPKSMRLRMRVLISQLDAPSNTPSGNTEVVYLRYLEAKTFAPLLGKIAQNIIGKDTGARYDASTALSNQSGPTTTSGGAPAAAKESSTNSTIIQAEPSTNAVIITAPPALMQALKSVVAKLDIRPKQVLVEAIIAEVDEANLRSLGVQWGSRGSDGVPLPQNSPPEGQSPTSFPPLGAGIFGIIPGGVQLRTVLSLLENSNGVDILSTPSVMVLDNQKALIEVGQEVPYQTGSYASTAGVGTVQPFNTTQAKPVTLKLEVTPQINLANSVRLKIALKNDTLQNAQNPGTNPIINTSKINNSVIIKSDDILVLGGLIQNSNIENINKVPIVGDLPIVGQFFQQKARNISKKNLIVFIKPVITTDREDAMMISHVKYDAFRRAQANYHENLADIGKEPAETRLPPWKNTRDLPKPFETRPS
jgi:general secretion pathway protein D